VGCGGGMFRRVSCLALGGRWGVLIILLFFCPPRLAASTSALRTLTLANAPLRFGLMCSIPAITIMRDLHCVFSLNLPIHSLRPCHDVSLWHTYPMEYPSCYSYFLCTTNLNDIAPVSRALPFCACYRLFGYAPTRST